MNKLISIGEFLIDFTGLEKGEFANISSFQKNPGGAPANTAVCVSRLGGRAELITKLGKDAFGDYLIKVLGDNGVGFSSVKRTSKAKTPLAFVSLDINGEREFDFYRNPSSDLFLEDKDIDINLFEQGDILHFCSVSLVDYPIKDAHRAAIKYANEKGLLICFDPNLRYPLWDNPENLIKTVKEFIPYAHILKIADDELKDITGINEEDKAVESLFVGNVKIIMITRGQDGSSVYFADGESFDVDGFDVEQKDSTGAGDTFIGTVLFQLLRDGKNTNNLTTDRNIFRDYIKYANKAASVCVTRNGAISAMPFYNEVF